MAKSVKIVNEKSETRNRQNFAHVENYWKDEDVELGLKNGTLIEVIFDITFLKTIFPK